MSSFRKDVGNTTDGCRYHTYPYEGCHPTRKRDIDQETPSVRVLDEVQNTVRSGQERQLTSGSGEPEEITLS